MSLGDGRSLCMECLGSAVMDTGECQPLYHSIRDYYEGMNMKLDQQIPMLLVERQALNEAMEGESRVSIPSGLFFLISCRMFSLRKETQTFTLHVHYPGPTPHA
jgi:hypothetical protein